MASLNWLSDPHRYQMVNPAVRVGCAVWLEGLSFSDPPDEFVVETVWSPCLRDARRVLGKPEREFRGRIRCVGDERDRTSEGPLVFLPQWGRRRFVFRDDHGWESPELRVTRRTAPSTVTVGLPAVGISLAEGPAGTSIGKAEVDLSKSLNIKTTVSAAIDPTVRVSLVSGHLLAPVWADTVARDSGLDSDEATRWLLQALESESPSRQSALDFLHAAEAAGLDADAATVDETRAVLREHPFATSDGAHGGGVEELAAARDYVVLLGEWGVEGLLLLAETYQELRSSPMSSAFTDVRDTPSVEAVIELDEGAETELDFTLVGMATEVTRFAVRVDTEIDGVVESDYSDVVSVAERAGDLVWWEDPEHLTMVEGQRDFVI